MSSSHTEKELKEYKAAFLLFDKDNSGSISKKELGAVMQSLGLKPNEKHLDFFMKQVDSDNNGTISFDEFLMLMSQQSSSKDEEEEDMKRVFKMFDKDNNGFITPSELKLAMASLEEKLSDEDIMDMIKEADTNGDGLVNYEEFLKMVKNKD